MHYTRQCSIASSISVAIVMLYVGRFQSDSTVFVLYCPGPCLQDASIVTVNEDARSTSAMSEGTRRTGTWTFGSVFLKRGSCDCKGDECAGLCVLLALVRMRAARATQVCTYCSVEDVWTRHVERLLPHWRCRVVARTLVETWSSHSRLRVSYAQRTCKANIHHGKTMASGNAPARRRHCSVCSSGARLRT